MKFKLFFSMLLAGSLLAGAQSQGYKDGIEYYKAGQYENAKTILTNTLGQAGTDQALANYYLGQTYLALKDKDAAKKYFDAGIAADADCAYNYVGLGALALLNGDTDSASDLFKSAQKLAKKNHEITVAIARAYYNADPVAFKKEIDKYLAKAHKDSKNTEPSIYILEGDMAFDAGNIGDAAAMYEMAISYDNANPEGYVKYANNYFKVNPQFSIAKLEEFLAVAPNSALGQRELAEKYYEGNYWNKAAEQYGRYIQNPNHFPEDKARYSVLLYYGEKYAESLRVANEILAQDPSHFLMQRLRFLNEVQMGDYQKGVDDAAAFFANNPNGYFTTNDFTTYADALTNLGQDSLAVIQYELAAEKFPDNADVQLALSAAYTKAKDYHKAAQAFDKYLENTPEPSLNDIYTGSARWLNVAATAGDNMELRAEAANKGIEYVNRVMERAQPDPSFLQRKARLMIAGNGNKPNAEAIATYGEMVAMLDADPANADATNPNNGLQLYKEAYMFSVAYYNTLSQESESAEAKEANDTLAKDFSAKLKEVNEKLGN